MKKIPTIFVRDETKRGHPVMNEIKPECQWVLDGEGTPTRKLDGTNVKIEQGHLFKRQKPQSGEYDEASYVPCERSNPGDKWAFSAFDALPWKADGIYELVGPKVQGNPEQFPEHTLMNVVPWDEELRLDALPLAARTFDGFREFLSSQSIEGIVFHHPDGRMAKIKRRDYGLPWPIEDCSPKGRR